MDSVVDVRECRWCHKPYRLHDGRYKYCSDECAEAARLAQDGQSYRDIVEALHEKRRQKILEDYWRRCMTAFNSVKRARCR